jgi:parallel beta-helix repeat protein
VGALRGANVLGNTISGNGQDGLLLFDLRESLVRGNRASGNKDGIDFYGGQKGSRRNQLVGNSATQNAHAGIWVRGDSPNKGADDNVISNNVTGRNGRAGGILVEGSAIRNKLRDNTANGNKGRGITAVSGTIDAGGNRARGNKRSPQCV